MRGKHLETSYPNNQTRLEQKGRDTRFGVVSVTDRLSHAFRDLKMFDTSLTDRLEHLV